MAIIRGVGAQKGWPSMAVFCQNHLGKRKWPQRGWCAKGLAKYGRFLPKSSWEAEMAIEGLVRKRAGQVWPFSAKIILGCGNGHRGVGAQKGWPSMAVFCQNHLGKRKWP